MSPVLVEVVRSGYVESRHCGSVIALRADGSVALTLGEVGRPVFPRSSNKPLQAAALLAAGWEPDTAQQVALAAASHSGEPEHLAVVASMVDDLALLRCPPALPVGRDAAAAVLRAGGGPTSAQMDCSGKHAAMLRTCQLNGWPTEGYLEVTHPVQQAVLAGIERLAGERVHHVAVDGCGAPQHALTLTGLARAFSRLVTGDGPERRVAEAMQTHPWYVGGTGREATRLMEGVPGLVAKDGAEAVFAAALPDGGAVALKIADGGERARMPVVVAALRALGCHAAVLDELELSPVMGGGRQVGQVRAAAALTAHA